MITGTLSMEQAARICGTTRRQLARDYDVSGDTIEVERLFTYVGDDGQRHELTADDIKAATNR